MGSLSKDKIKSLPHSGTSLSVCSGLHSVTKKPLLFCASANAESLELYTYSFRQDKWLSLSSPEALGVETLQMKVFNDCLYILLGTADTITVAKAKID